MASEQRCKSIAVFHQYLAFTEWKTAFQQITAEQIDSWSILPLSIYHFGKSSSATDVAKKISFLIDKKPNLNIYDRRGAPPLHEALYSRLLTVVSLLLKAGANANQAYYGGSSYTFPLDIRYDSPEYTKELLNAGAFEYSVETEDGSFLERTERNRKLHQEWKRVFIAMGLGCDVPIVEALRDKF
jgi:hypothetical protein